MGSCKTTAEIGSAAITKIQVQSMTEEGMAGGAAEPWVIEHAGATDRGRVRRVNEDAWGACSPAGRQEGAFVVCDGMGGAAAGETASRLAAEQALTYLCEDEPSAGQVEAAIRKANATVFAAAQRDWRLEGMGTTLVGLRLRAARAWVVHVGDSRCYLYRKGSLKRLTRDHSLVEEQVRSGRMTREQARRSPMQNVITRAVGTRAEVAPEVQEMALVHGDIFLLVSDGLTREVGDAAIERMLREQAGGGDLAGTDLAVVCQRLIAAANEHGGHDNITCLLVRC
jgi:protein phosphatase